MRQNFHNQKLVLKNEDYIFQTVKIQLHDAPCGVSREYSNNNT